MEIMLKHQTMKNGSTQLEVKCPYLPEFPPAARALGGKWNRETQAWYFDPRDEERVRELLLTTYGVDGSPQGQTDLVDLRVTFLDRKYVEREGIYLAGRLLARAYGRDSGARLGEKVVVLEGRGFGSGGSLNNWITRVEPGTVVEIRDVPRRAAEAAIREADGTMRLEIVEHQLNQDAIRVEQLESERAALLKRLAEVEQELTRLRPVSADEPVNPNPEP